MIRRFQWGDRANADDRARIAPERAEAMMQEAGAALDRKDIETARSLYTESIAIFHARSMRREEADALHALAQMLVTESDYPAAFDAYTQVIALYRKLNTRGQLAVTLRDAGYASTDCGETEQAHNLLAESMQLFDVTGDKCGMASALEGMGIAAQESQDLDSAREYFQRSLSLHRELDLNPESAVSLIYLSIIALTRGELDTAEALYHESIDRFREDNSESSLIPPLLTLGDVAFTTEDSIQIGELLQAALAVFGASRLKRSWDSAMVKLGGVAQRRNVNRSALEVYRHSLSVDPARDEWGSEAIACLGLGCVAYRQDKPKIGKALVARSLNLCRLNGDTNTIIYVLSYAAAYTYRCQHYPDSKQYHVQCADAARNKADDDLQTADALCYAAFLAYWQCEYEEARKYCVEAIAVYRTRELSGDTARAQSLLGSIFCSLGDLETGTKIHQEAIAASKRLGEPVAIGLALSAMAASLTRTDEETARECLQESLNLLQGQEPGIQAEVMQNLGELDRIYGRHIDAYSRFCESLTLKIADADRFGSAATLVSAGITAAASGQFEAAATILEKAASIRTRMGIVLPAPVKEDLDFAVVRLRTELGESYSRISGRCEAMTMTTVLGTVKSIESLIEDPPPPVDVPEDAAGDISVEVVDPLGATSLQPVVAGAEHLP